MNGTSDHGWSTWLGVPELVLLGEPGRRHRRRAVTDGKHELAVMMVDDPPGPERGPVPAAWTSTPTRPPRAPGSCCRSTRRCWPIHAAALPLGQGDVLRRLRQQPGARDASPDYGNVAKGIYTSVVWDPAAPAAGGANFFHPDTITRTRRQAVRLLLRRRHLPARRDAAVGRRQPGLPRQRADPTRSWLRPGRPSSGTTWPHGARPLVPHPAAAGRRPGAGRQRPERERQRSTPRSRSTPRHRLPGTTCRSRRAACSSACPCTRTCSCCADGRVLFTGGRMDDPNPQGP